MGGHKHSKNSDARAHFGYHEKAKAFGGSTTQRLGTDSQLPFGYCCLSLKPAHEPVVSPSGHIYSREVILEYLLTKTKEIKKQSQLYEAQQNRLNNVEHQKQQDLQMKAIESFVKSEDSVSSSSNKRKFDEKTSTSNSLSRKQKLIDETSVEEKLEGLKSVCPWIPQFTPSAPDTLVSRYSVYEVPPVTTSNNVINSQQLVVASTNSNTSVTPHSSETLNNGSNEQIAKPKLVRPSSPCSKQPLRIKDLIPINLEMENASSNNNNRNDNNGSIVRFICPVSKDTITSQQIVLIKPTGVVMTEEVAKQLAYPSGRCPITSKKFDVKRDILVLQKASTGFSSTGAVEATIHRPSIN